DSEPRGGCRQGSPMSFKTTQWNLVADARSGSETAVHAALDMLCQSYWGPVFNYVLRFGYSPEDAQDLTQDFFARCLRTNSFSYADQSRGRFRTYVLTSIKHLLNEDWRRRC